ncbi:MAG: hypothetical protein ACPG8F_00795 [Flavobacteriaceae bacterium]
MEELYSKKNKTTVEGPSDLTIKRILAFSKALNVSKSNPANDKLKERKS